MKLAKTTLVVFAIVAGITFQAHSQNQAVKIEPVSKDVYQLSFLKENPGKVKVEITDESGQLLYNETIHQKEPFTKPFDFRNFTDGNFTIKVTDAEDTYLTKINRTEEVNMVASIIRYKDDKAKVIVEGDAMEPVYITIYDQFGVSLYEDTIDRERGFSRIYDLSQLNVQNEKIEVVAGNKILASSRILK